MATLDQATSYGTSVDVTTAAAYIPELWSKEIIKARTSNMVMVDKIMHVSPQGLAYGDTVNIPKLGNESARTKTAGSAISYDAATDTSVTILINQYKYVGKLIEDIVSVQSNYDLFSNFTDKIGIALGQAVDQAVLALTAPAGANAYSVGSHVAMSIAETFINAGVRILNSFNVPIDDRYLVVDPYGYEDLLNITDFIRYDAGGKTPVALETGQVGQIFGLKVLLSNNLSIPTATSAYGMIFHKDAFAIALQKDVTMKTEYSVDYIGTKMVGYEIYGVTWARTDHFVLLKYTAS
jgi:hypothetical protein